MKELSIQQIILIFLAINVVTFVVYGIDKWKAKHAKWRINETQLMALAVLGGSIGAWLGMKIWHHKTMHKKFFAEQSGKAERKYGLPLILLAQITLIYLIIQK